MSTEENKQPKKKRKRIEKPNATLVFSTTENSTKRVGGLPPTNANVYGKPESSK